MHIMTQALKLAAAAARAGEVPVGAVITDSQGATVATAEVLSSVRVGAMNPPITGIVKLKRCYRYLSFPLGHNVISCISR